MKKSVKSSMPKPKKGKTKNVTSMMLGKKAKRGGKMC